MVRFFLAFLSCAAWAFSAQALTCTSKDNDIIKVMYKAYVQSGYLPRGKIETFQPVGNGVTVNGSVTGIMEFESCWKDSPPCSARPEYSTAKINFVTSNNEVKKVFGADANNALLECFRKIGLATQDKSSGFFGGIFR